MVTFVAGAVVGFIAAWLVAAGFLMWLAAHDPRELAPWEGDGAVPGSAETDGEVDP